LCANVTLAIKPEANNVSQRPNRAATVCNRHKKLVKIVDRLVPEICSRTDRQTDALLIAVLRRGLLGSPAGVRRSRHQSSDKHLLDAADRRLSLRTRRLRARSARSVNDHVSSLLQCFSTQPEHSNRRYHTSPRL